MKTPTAWIVTLLLLGTGVDGFARKSSKKKSPSDRQESRQEASQKKEAVAEKKEAPSGEKPSEGAEREWAVLEEANTRLVPPEDWDGASPTREMVRQWVESEKVRLLKVADQAHDFFDKYGDSPFATRALRKEFEALDSLDRIVPQEVKERTEFVTEVLLKRPDLEKQERFEVQAGRLMRTAKNAEELEAGARELLKEYPDGQAYEILLSAARGSDHERGRSLAEEVLKSNAPEPVRERAEGLLKRFDAVGKPLEMSFEATNGREVDVQKMRGKVVVIDFWATWCGPCVSELPTMKGLYERLKAKGLEVLGVSFDSDALQFEKFINEHSISWPQYMDSGGWHSRFAEEYGITSIPTVWLVDKKGILRDLNAWAGLEQKVEALLAE